MTPHDCMTAGGVVCRSVVNGRVEVEFAALPQCRGCEGVCMWRRLSAVNRAEFATALRLEVGDQVSVSVPQRYVLFGSLLVYGLPMAALLGGGLVGVALTGSDLGCLLGAMAAVVLAVVATPGLRRRIEKMTLRQITVVPRRSASAA